MSKVKSWAKIWSVNIYLGPIPSQMISAAIRTKAVILWFNQCVLQ